jgi:8-oxo-dGTP diphosphatase
LFIASFTLDPGSRHAGHDRSRIRRTFKQCRGDEAKEMTSKPMGAAAVITDESGRVLLVKHTYGRLNWELPGGGAEAHESAAETAVREVREETGLHVVVERLAGVYYEREPDMHHFVFVCRPLGVSADSRPDRVEISECTYWPSDALPRPISDFTIRRVRDALGESGAASIVTVPPRRWFE